MARLLLYITRMNVRSVPENPSSKRVQIMEHAIKLFVTQGFQQTSMAQLSKSSGIAIGTMYHHFKGKDELIEQTYLYVTEKFGAFVRFHDAETSLSFKERFRLLWVRSYTYFVDHPNYFYFKDTLNYSPLVSAELKEEGTKYYQASVDMIAEGIEQRLFINNNPVVLGRWIYNSIITATQITLNNELQMDESTLDEFFEMTWRSIVKKSD
ncbi:MAG: TetR/AcrR family transcriptional regulator [Bacteroidota bacterium]